MVLGPFRRDSAERQRQKLLRGALAEPLRHYVETPLADPALNGHDTEFLAVDFETTGLDPQRDTILSIGFTRIHHARVQMRENRHYFVNPEQQLPPESVAIHRITDDQARQGIALEAAIPLLLEQLAGRVMLVHFQRIEKQFLGAACRHLYGHAPPLRIVDTLELARRKMRHVLFGPHHLRLFNLRRQFGLPRYHAHNALEDAIATAELLLAMYAREFEPGHRHGIRPLLSP